jgi:hypothetical protein
VFGAVELDLPQSGGRRVYRARPIGRRLIMRALIARTLIAGAAALALRNDDRGRQQ